MLGRHAHRTRPGQLGRSNYSLDSSSDRAEDDGKVHRPWLAPLVSDLPADRVSLVVGQALDGLEVGGILCYEGALSQQRQRIFDPVLGRKLVHVTEKLSLGDAGQRVLHSVFPQLDQYVPSLNSVLFQLGGVSIFIICMVFTHFADMLCWRSMRSLSARSSSSMSELPLLSFGST